MAICSFFLQGRCKFGDRCWNEHPRDGRHQGHNRYQSQGSEASSSWNSSGQRYVQPSNFSRNLTWTRDNDRSSAASGSSDNRNRSSKPNAPSGFFSPQNRYSALANQDFTKDVGQDKEDNILADVLLDLETWESCGIWQLSVYCVLKEQRHLSGFADISPEELRLECYTSLKEGQLQNYVSSVQQLVMQWKQRIHDIKNTSNSALLSQLIKPPTAATAPSPFGGAQQSGSFGGAQQSGSFGGAQQSGFGTSSTSDNKTSAVNFSFKLDSHTAAPNAGASSSFSSGAAFGNKPPFGFGNTGTGAASTFSFAPTTALGGAAPTGFGSASAAPGMATSGFGSSVSSGFGGPTTGGFGSSVSAVPGFGGAPSASGFGGLPSSTMTSGFGAATTGLSSPSTAGTSLFGQVATASSSSSSVSTSADVTTSSNALFTPQSELSQEDLLQYESKMFTLGKVPLVPPPVELLTIR